ncbi:MAG: hypothetical protein MZV70_75560 [Desulfobacterales bacterium]|nr:hypothetical protein [Desulfobacterales bacterium]
MRYCPIGLDISGRRCLVIGGGEVGERKAQRLLECGARVSVVGSELTPALAGLRQEGRIDHIPGDYDKGLLKGAFLVIGATGRPCGQRAHLPRCPQGGACQHR